MGKLSRTKGCAFERHIANRLKLIYPHARRGIGQARAGGEVPDVDGTPMWIECKHERRPNPFAALKQARLALTDTREPTKYAGGVVVIARKQGGEDIAVLPLDDYLTLMTELEILRARVPAATEVSCGRTPY